MSQKNLLFGKKARSFVGRAGGSLGFSLRLTWTSKRIWASSRDKKAARRERGRSKKDRFSRGYSLKER